MVPQSSCSTRTAPNLKGMSRMVNLGRLHRTGLLAALLAFLLAAPARSQGAPPAGARGAGRVTGRVLERGRDPVPYANVKILGTVRLGALTDENGNFVIS